MNPSPHAERACTRGRRLRLPNVAFTVLLALLAASPLAAVDGALDPTFNGSGKAVINVGVVDIGLAVAAQPDGKILVAGKSELPTAADPDNVAFSVARRNANGTADLTFGPLANGEVTIDFDLGEPGQRQDVATSVAVQPDGKIVVAGYATVNIFERHIAVARLTPTGLLDATFGGGDGKATYVSATGGGIGRSCAVLVTSNGRIVLTPSSEDGDNALLSLSASGAPDPSFPNQGRSDSWGCDQSCSSVKTFEMPNGKLVTVGRNQSEVVLVRFQSYGSLDLDFGDDGAASFTPPGPTTELVDAAVDNAGRVVVLSKWTGDVISNSVLLRVRGEAADPSFGSGGWAAFSFLPAGVSDAYVTALAVQPDGKPIVAGVSMLDGNNDFLVTRRTADGNAVDSSFSGGWRRIPFDLSGEELADAAAAVILSAGRPVLAGSASDGLETQLAVARLENALLWSDGFESGTTWRWETTLAD